MAEAGGKPFLAVFDMDGTLVDSRDVIVRTMQEAVTAAGLVRPDPLAITQLVGLSLPRLIETLCPDASAEAQAKVLSGYKDRFANNARETGESMLYPGVTAGLDRLQRAGIMLGVATGKSKRGLDRLIASKGWTGLFATQQCADFHPSKPHPSMVQGALDETGTTPGQAVMVGDTTFDVEMARAAGVATIGVGWGYHTEDALRGAGADQIVSDFAALVDEIERRAA